MTDLLGTWTLVSCISQRGDTEVSTFGEPPAGQLQYTADGRMSAFLMDPAWAAAGNPVADGFTEFFSYGGLWRRDGDMVTHDILFASQPSRVGTSFTRQIVAVDDDTVELVTKPEVSKSGRTYVTRLLWKRVGTAQDMAAR
ncbi:lipocalin-like domain-containing protein [Sphingomonas radiodurans]|uniref:lipocalin-like domain-containing protein n=1 Tax=Sphingomonas radiodurans TaxID=2890321 RepID=UPI001E6036A6|nr:lipocalin-like domain-containing protein [Sphingomonas radiodurans]WBH15882.1 lipocalin-like domain-containing protein [Sphingomonas radiodurans]